MVDLNRIKIDNEFLHQYWIGNIDIADTRGGMVTILTTGETVRLDDYPVLYALRKLNYSDNFTREELYFITEENCVN